MLGKNFSKLLASASASSLGDGVRYTAIPLLAASYTRNPLLLSTVGVASGLPWLLFSLPLGAISDRRSRRSLMITSHTARAAAGGLFVLALALKVHNMALVVAFTLLLGTFEVLFESSSQAALPMLVAPDDLNRANSRLSGSIMLCDEFVGPPLGAALFGVFAALPFLFDAGSFAVAALLLVAIPLTFTPDRQDAGAGQTLRQDIREAANWLWHSGLIKRTIISATALNLVRSGTLAILVLYALQILHTGKLGFGLLSTTLAAGSLLGATLSGRTLRYVPERLLLLGAPALIGADYLLMGFIQQAFVVGAGMALLGLLTMIWNIVAISTRQRLTPNNLMGRVASLSRFVSWGATPVGAVLGGVAARLAGLPAPFIAGGVLLIALTVASAVPSLRHPEREPDGPGPAQCPESATAAEAKS